MSAPREGTSVCNVREALCADGTDVHAINAIARQDSKGVLICVYMCVCVCVCACCLTLAVARSLSTSFLHTQTHTHTCARFGYSRGCAIINSFVCVLGHPHAHAWLSVCAAMVLHSSLTHVCAHVHTHAHSMAARVVSLTHVCNHCLASTHVPCLCYRYIAMLAYSRVHPLSSKHTCALLYACAAFVLHCWLTHVCTH